MWFRVRTAQELGRSVGAMRRGRGMSQAELADWMGVDRTTVVRLESGAVGALDRLLSALAVAGAEMVIVPRGATVTVEPGTSHGH